MVKGAVLQCCAIRDSGFAPRRCRNGATHNWPSVVQVREGLAGRDIFVSSATPVAGRAQCALTKVARCTVFPPTHWCGWLPG